MNIRVRWAVATWSVITSLILHTGLCYWSALQTPTSGQEIFWEIYHRESVSYLTGLLLGVLVPAWLLGLAHCLWVIPEDPGGVSPSKMESPVPEA